MIIFLTVLYYVCCIACFGSVLVGMKWLMEEATLQKILVGLVAAALAAGMVDMWFHTPVFKGTLYAVACLFYVPFAKWLAGRKEE